MLFIDDSLIIDNSGWKWGSYQMSGQIGLEAGKHTFILQHIYSYCCGSPTLDLYIKGPGISEQILPSSMLYRDNTCDPTGDKPAAPDNLRFNVLSGNSVEIIWDDNSNNEGGFLVETDNTREWNTYDTYKEIVSVGSNITSYVNNHLIPNDTIKYRIRAFNAYGYSDYCAVDSVVTGSTTDYKPISPDLLEANYIEDHQINITWRDNSYNEEGFIVEYKKIEDTSYTVAGTSGMDMNNFSITGLESNTDYHIRVKAFNNEGESGYSQEIQVKTLVTDVYAVKVDNVNNKIVLAPNPTNGIVNVFNAPDPVDDFRVINMMGEQVMRLESASQIDLGGLPEGIYLIKIGSNIVKVVKQ